MRRIVLKKEYLNCVNQMWKRYIDLVNHPQKWCLPVSYTHLDVYKRQELLFTEAEEFAMDKYQQLVKLAQG